jgi:hypothetical protein
MRLAFSSAPAQMIADLRALVENQNKTRGGKGDQINTENNVQKDNVGEDDVAQDNAIFG